MTMLNNTNSPNNITDVDTSAQLTNFHGSYHPNDVTFLLKPLQEVGNLPPVEKEKVIQSGQRHYSEMLNKERLPSVEYMQVFYQAMSDNALRMAKDCVALAQNISQNFAQPILVSLARAGTPVGVVIKHLLTDILKHDVPHYSISIIRDRGIDTNAIDFILNHHNSDGNNVIFIDGWTGKGVITGELMQAVKTYNHQNNTRLQPNLYVLSDLAGVAWQSASFEDYLIPSAILNSTVSGLVSRSVLDHQITDNDFHGCLFYKQFLEQDVSQEFVQTLLTHSRKIQQPISIPDKKNQQHQKQQMSTFIIDLSQEFGIEDVNLIKPGIGEATRVLLRRVPEKLIVKSLDDFGVAHLLLLAKEKLVTIIERPQMPFRAVSLIQSSKK